MPQSRPVQASPLTFEQKMAWILRLEDQRILRAADPPPAAVAAAISDGEGPARKAGAGARVPPECRTWFR